MKRSVKKVRWLNHPQYWRLGIAVFALLLMTVFLLAIHWTSTKDTNTTTDLVTITNAAVGSQAPATLAQLHLTLRNNSTNYGYSPANDNNFNGETFDLCATFYKYGLDVTDPLSQYQSSGSTVTSAGFGYHHRGHQCFTIYYDFRHSGVTVRPDLSTKEQEVARQKDQAQYRKREQQSQAEIARSLATQPKIKTRYLDYNLLIATTTNIVKMQTQLLGIEYQSQDLVKSCYETDGEPISNLLN